MRRLRTILNVLAAANVAVAAWDVATGGIYFTAFGVVFSSWELAKPLRYAAVCAALSMVLRDRATPGRSWEILGAWAGRLAATVAILSALVAARFAVTAAGSADAYGYVSQAKLWLDRSLIVPDPLAPLRPQLGLAAAPVGYTLAADGPGLVPVYPPGLSLLMAAARWLRGPQAVYAVVPLLAGIAVWMTFLVAERTAGARAAAAATILLASNPLFLFQSFQPMSDVPVTAWWTAAWAMSLAPGSWAAFVAGVSAAAAIITRPNLAPLVLVVAAVIVAMPPRWRRIAYFAAPVAVACAVVLAFNHLLYGSSFMTGYGPPRSLFALSNARANLAAYFTWTRDLFTPLIFLGFAAPLIVRRSAVAWMIVFSIGVLASYVFYMVFDSWPFERFLLPAAPLLYAATMAIVVRAIERLPLSVRPVTLFSIVTLLLVHHAGVAQRLHIFDTQTAEQRYADVGRYIECLPAEAVVFATVHSGSVRMYGDRLTVRWDALPPDGLDRAVAALRDAGYAPYFLLEGWEEPLFRRHFAGSELGRIDWPPMLEYPYFSHTRVYRVDDRARHFSGEPIETRPIPPGS